MNDSQNNLRGQNFSNDSEIDLVPSGQTTSKFSLQQGNLQQQGPLSQSHLQTTFLSQLGEHQPSAQPYIQQHLSYTNQQHQAHYGGVFRHSNTELRPSQTYIRPQSLQGHYYPQNQLQPLYQGQFEQQQPQPQQQPQLQRQLAENFSQLHYNQQGRSTKNHYSLPQLLQQAYSQPWQKRIHPQQSLLESPQQQYRRQQLSRAAQYGQPGQLQQQYDKLEPLQRQYNHATSYQRQDESNLFGERQPVQQAVLHHQSVVYRESPQKEFAQERIRQKQIDSQEASQPKDASEKPTRPKEKERDKQSPVKQSTNTLDLTFSFLTSNSSRPCTEEIVSTACDSPAATTETAAVDDPAVGISPQTILKEYVPTLEGKSKQPELKLSRLQKSLTIGCGFRGKRKKQKTT